MSDAWGCGAFCPGDPCNTVCGGRAVCCHWEADCCWWLESSQCNGSSGNLIFVMTPCFVLTLSCESQAPLLTGFPWCLSSYQC